MASTFLSLHYHIVFSTKNRKPFIKESWAGRLHSYLAGTVKGLGGFPERVGGVEDHVHLLVGLKATHTLSDFMRELKKSSSTWVHNEIGELEFAWQQGYSAFTVGATSRKGVKIYITNQPEHHRQRSYREELICLLQKAGIEYNEAYLD